jgi:Ni,Fe-hydrogenase III large subunit
MNEQYDFTHPITTAVFSFEKNVIHSILIKEGNEYELIKNNNLSELLQDIYTPIWAIRHGLGKNNGAEDLQTLERLVKTNYHLQEERNKEIDLSLINQNEIKSLFYNGLTIKTTEDGYSHAVGPIHAGVIEPGHFRFFVKGEEIQHLTIRLGFQHRGILKKLVGKNYFTSMPISESIASDSAVGYAITFAKNFEKASGIIVDEDIELKRTLLLEIERIAVHIADIGAIAGDVGYYPLLGLCATDRGVPLGVMEILTGSRFGKGAIFPGEVILNEKLNDEKIRLCITNLTNCFHRVESQMLRAMENSTIRERLQDCGRLTKKMVKQNGFLGIVSKSSGLHSDLREQDPLFKKYPIHLYHDEEHLTGDAWARFIIRYLELKESIEWINKILPLISIKKRTKGRPLFSKIEKYSEGIYYSYIEAWRGPLLSVLQIDTKGCIQNAYIRDPSVLNWHALELAVRGELIGDFPLNNKSFNLSYVGFDL